MKRLINPQIVLDKFFKKLKNKSVGINPSATELIITDDKWVSTSYEDAVETTQRNQKRNKK